VRPSSAPPGSAAPDMGCKTKPIPSVSRQLLATVLRRTSISGLVSVWRAPPWRRRVALEARRPASRMASSRSCTILFVRLSPFDKRRIIRALQSIGRVVGFVGDGINDAPALRVADVGISVDTAVDIAKEAADTILLEKSLLVLEEGVIEGRKVFANILKYIRMGASSNFG